MTELLNLLTEPVIQTIYMVIFSTIFSLLLGFPGGILLMVTEKGGIFESKHINQVLGNIVNMCRSFPFIILMILVFPLSRFIVGTSIGTTATIVPLSIAAAPFVARVIESALKELSPGVIEASKAMGSSRLEIIFKVMIPEAMPAIVDGITLTIINLIGYSAMAGAIGGGGLGDLAIRFGYYRFQTDVMIASVIILLVFVQLIQSTGNYVSLKLINNR